MSWQSWVSDFRTALQSLLSNLKSSLLLAGVFALGVGANVGVFSLFSSIVLQPPIFPDAQELVAVYNRWSAINLERGMTSVPDYVDRRDRLSALANMGLYRRQSLNLSMSQDGAERVEAYRITASVLETLDVPPLLGRWFSQDAETVGQHRLVVLSHDFWTSRFASDQAVVGRDVKINDEIYRVVAVMPQGFDFPTSNVQAWVPYAFTPEELSESSRSYGTSEVIGRLAPGVTLQQLDAQLAALSARIVESAGSAEGTYGSHLRNSGFSIRAELWRDLQVAGIKPVLLLLQVAAVLVMLLACANISNVLIARQIRGQQALSLRMTLGARRERLVRAFLLEVLLIALGGGTLGLALIDVTFHVAAGLGGLEVLGKRVGTGGLDVAATIGLSVFAAVAAATIPALSLFRMNLGAAIRDGSRMTAGQKSARARIMLVVTQVALSTALLVASGLLIVSMWRAANQPPGFEADAVFTVNVDLAGQRYPDQESRRRYVERAIEDLDAEPGVISAAFVSALPFSGANSSGAVEIQRSTSMGSIGAHALHREISANYFASMGIDLLQGRTFDPMDQAGGEPVVVVDEFLIRNYFGTSNPMEARIQFGLPPQAISARVVGVVKTIHHSDLTTPISKGTIYWPLNLTDRARGSFVIRVQIGVESMQKRVLGVLKQIDSQQPVYEASWLSDRVHRSLDRQRTPMYLIGLFSAVSLVLAGVGVYGVVGMSVEQRQGEIATRLALGGTPGDVVWFVGSQVARWLLVGQGLGVLAAMAMSSLMSGWILDVSGESSAIHLAAAIVVILASVLAVAGPLRRVARIAPSLAIRS